MLRVASCAKAISPKAAIQLTCIELVIGKPKTRPISPAFRDRPCSSGAAADGEAAGRPASADSAPTTNVTCVLKQTNNGRLKAAVPTDC